MDRFLLLLSAVNGFLAVALGAFGAHGLKARLAEAADGAQRLGWWETAAQYHLAHALALGIAAVVARDATGATSRAGGIAFQVGILLFCGSLYVMGAGGPRWLGAVTPLGGLGFLIGWALLGWVAWRLRG